MTTAPQTSYEKTIRTRYQPSIRDLALIGDKRSCALIDKEGTIAWYSLWRFDQPSLFSSLIDDNGGYWAVEAEGKSFQSRQYINDSAILETTFQAQGGMFTVTDFMSFTDLSGICRLFSASPVPITVTIVPKPNYGRSAPSLKMEHDNHIVSDSRFEYYVKASHPLKIVNESVNMKIPAGNSGWCVLMDNRHSLKKINSENLRGALAETEGKWQSIMENISYEGPYKDQFYQSYKAIQLVTHEKNGGILAAATTSLLEAIGGMRNYDYRYVWLRDTAMNVSALIRAESRGKEALRFLDFLCAGRNTNKKDLFIPFYDLDYKTAP